MPFPTDQVARLKIFYVGTSFDDVADGTRRPTTIGTGMVFRAQASHLYMVNVCSADARAIHLDQHIVDAELRLWNVLQPQSRLRLALD